MSSYHVFFLVALSLTFIIPALSAIEFLDSPENAAVLLGQDVTLNCRAEDSNFTGDLLYEWDFQGGPVSTRSSLFANHSLFLPRIQQSDFGEYGCTVTRGDISESSRESATIIETYTEEFLTGPLSVTATQGQEVEFTCITGRSAPRSIAFWEKDGVRFYGGVQNNASYGSIDPLGLGVQLSLKIQLLAGTSTKGAYRCVSENPLSQVVKKSQSASLILAVPDLPPSFELSPPPEVFISEGQSYSVDCVVSGVPKPGITWIHNGVDVVNDSRRFVALNGTLVFTSVTEVDKGVYLCQGRNSAGSISSGFMTFHVPKLELQFRQQPVDVHAVAGQSARILCSPPVSDPPAQITWFKGSSPFEMRTGRFAVSVDRSISEKWDLVFSNVQQNDEGDYLCVASNTYSVPQSRTSRLAKLSVTGGAVFVEPPIGQDLIKGELLQLKCVVEGNPTPVITWYKDGEPLVLSERVKLVRSNQELYITAMTKPDEGTYQCNVANNFNNITASAFVRVRVPPAILSQIGHVTVNLGMRSEFSLPCEVSGDPDPEVVWFHNSDEVKYSDRIRFINDQLYVQEVTVDDSGSYECLARNSAGSKTITGTVDVIVPPSFRQKPVSRGVTLGGGISLRCEAAGVPDPTIMWNFNETLALPDKVLVSADKTVITIATMRWKDSGRYKCIANNSAGRDTTSAVLSIQTVPVITDVSGENVLPRGRDVQLSCQSTGIPSPEIYWLYEGAKISTSLDGRITFPTTTTILIKFATEADSGRYTCVANSSAGQDQENKQVIVYGVPVPPELELVTPLSPFSVNITWLPREQAPYADITNYILYYKENVAAEYVVFSDQIPQDWTNIEMDGLKPNTEYVVKMAARNLAGTGADGSVRGFKTFESAPSPPRNLEVSGVKSDRVTLRWELPKVTNGEIRQYQVMVREKDRNSGTLRLELIQSPTRPLQEFILESLTPHTTYLIQVRAATVLEDEATVWGNYTDPLEVITLYAAPTGSPQNVTVTQVTSRSYMVSWQPLLTEETNGPIKSYLVRYTPIDPNGVNQSELVNFLQNEVRIVKNVLPWTTYEIAISAQNEGGVGPESEAVTVKTKAEAPTGSPQEVKATPLAGEAILVEWKPVLIGQRNGPISGYLVRYGVQEEVLRSLINISSPDVFSTVIRHVLPNTQYEISVLAFTSEVAEGQGPYSPPVFVLSLKIVPGSVRNITYTYNRNTQELILRWLPPDGSTGLIRQYIIRYRPENNEGVSEVRSPSSETTTTLANLSTDTTYQINVTAENEAGEGEVTTINITTDRDAVSTEPNVTNKPPDLLGVPPPRSPYNPSKHLPAIVAGSLTGGLVVIFIVAIFIYKCCKKRCQKNEERY